MSASALIALISSTLASRSAQFALTSVQFFPATKRKAGLSFLRLSSSSLLMGVPASSAEAFSTRAMFSTTRRKKALGLSWKRALSLGVTLTSFPAIVKTIFAIVLPFLSVTVNPKKPVSPMPKSLWGLQEKHKPSLRLSLAFPLFSFQRIYGRV